MLSKKNIVSTQSSDHYLLEGDFATTLGQMHIGTLNLLIRKTLRLYQPQPEGEVLVRLNLPLIWVLNSPIFSQIEEQLKFYGIKLRLTLLKEPDHGHKKKQLELVGLESNLPVMSLPPVTKFYFEDEEEFHERMCSLGSLVGKRIEISLAKKELNFFTIQELQTDDLAFSFFLKGLRANGRSYLECFHEKKPVFYAPAILYDNRQFQRISMENAIDEQRKIDAFKHDLCALIRGNYSDNEIGQLLIAAFKQTKLDNLILVASFHANFAVMNQSANQASVLIKELAELAASHHIVLAGDFNQKIHNTAEAEFIQKQLGSDYYSVKLKSTKPGLQMHNTLDGLIVPYSLY
ncbi:MAG: hypothetical protein HKM04_00850 [Legionellales bacterium]|nr:hypothetical protein [Legionellales bacterium]